MDKLSEEVGAKERDKLDHGGVRYIVRTTGSLILQAVIFFVAAGSLNIFRGWILYGLMVGSMLFGSILLYVVDPKLLNQRGKNPEGVKTWDRVILAVWGILLFGFAIVAGLDVGRYFWTIMDFNWIYVGIVLYMIGVVLGTWPMFVNRHFEATVRIQTDKGHQVVTTGPYRIVRHPAYLGIVIAYLGLPLIVGSILSYLIVGAMIGLVIIRTYLEDETLQEELVGYKEYTQKTRKRLIPGIW